LKDLLYKFNILAKKLLRGVNIPQQLLLTSALRIGVTGPVEISVLYV
tara:strand:- start:601 stop:741 length:141 start_codon:yes stop_codon:yes gene_type:complete